MKITRLFTGDDGESAFEDIEIPLQDAGEIGRLSAVLPATGIIFRENDAVYDYDWHNAPQRQIIVLLDGEIEIEIGDGTKRRFVGGDVILAEDTTGRGHRSRNLGKTPRRSVFIPLQ